MYFETVLLRSLVPKSVKFIILAFLITMNISMLKLLVMSDLKEYKIILLY